MNNGLPPPSAALFVLGALIMELERIEPGALARVRQRVESMALRTAIVRLRGPKQEPEVIIAAEEAVAWIGAASLIAEVAPKRKKRRG